MRKETVTINIFEKGDRVITPNGYGTIINDNIDEITNKNINLNDFNFIYNDNFFHEVIVQYDNNKTEQMEASIPSLLKPGDEGYKPIKGCINDTSK